MVSLVVRKYGGSSVSAPEQILAIAKDLARIHAQGHSIVVVISAMGRTTDQLVQLSRSISNNPSLREMDMLLSSGERISMALLAMALNSENCPAISYTGSQAGILTTSAHSDARIIDLRPYRVETSLAEKKVVVLAGFQGVCPAKKEVTTLGRGGSDTTAVALAGFFKAPRCEILKDVDGIYSADPQIVDQAVRHSVLRYETVLEMTFWGAKVLHFRSVQLAKNLDVPLFVGLAHGKGRGTLITKEALMYENNQVVAITSHTQVQAIHVQQPDLNSAFATFEGFLKDHEIPLPSILDYQNDQKGFLFYVTATPETLASLIENIRHETALCCHGRPLCTVTLIGGDLSALVLPKKVAQILANADLDIEKMRMDGQSLTIFLGMKDRQTAIRLLHDQLILKESTLTES